MSMLNNEVRFERLSLTNESKSTKVYVTTDLRIAYVHRGEAQWKISEQIHHVKPGFLVLLSNNNPRVFAEINPECPLDLFVINVCPQFLFSFGILLMFTNMSKDLSPVIDDCTEEIISLVKKVEYESNNKLPHNQIIISATTILILTLLARKRGIKLEPGIIKPNMKDVLEYIDENYCDEINLSQLAEMAHMNKDVFSKYFRKCNGVPVSQYIRHKRIAKAIKLIETTDLTILDIAMQCGFKNMANFYKSFRAVTGKTPSDLKI